MGIGIPMVVCRVFICFYRTIPRIAWNILSHGDLVRLVGFWNMYGTAELLEALEQVSANVLNLALVPRVSRAQKLDALTSMANIAGSSAIVSSKRQTNPAGFWWKISDNQFFLILPFIFSIIFGTILKIWRICPCSIFLVPQISPSHLSCHHLVGFVKIDPPPKTTLVSSDHQWMGWKKHLQETMVFPMVFPIFVVVSCKPIHGYHDSKRKNPLVQGYRAVLDAFQRFPRFSRAGSTAFGSVPPAKVFVIGAEWGWGGGGDGMGWDGMGWEICQLFSCQVSNLLLEG